MYQPNDRIIITTPNGEWDVTVINPRKELYGLTFNEQVDIILANGLAQLEELRDRVVNQLKLSNDMRRMQRLLKQMANEVLASRENQFIKFFDGEAKLGDTLRIRMPSDWVKANA